MMGRVDRLEKLKTRNSIFPRGAKRLSLLHIRAEHVCGVLLVQFPSLVQLFATPRTAARQASLSLTISWSFLKLMSLESSDAIRPSHPLLPSSAPAFTFSQHFWSFPMSQPFAFGDQSIGASASDLPVNIQD